MKQFLTKVKEEVAKLVAKWLIVILLSPVLILAALIPKDAIRRVDSLIWFWSAVILFIACLALVIYIFRQRDKDIFIKELSVWREKKTGNYVCPSCKSNGKRSYLKEYEDRLVCLTKDCRRPYFKAGKEPKSQGRRVIHPGIDSGGWVRNWKI